MDLRLCLAAANKTLLGNRRHKFLKVKILGAAGEVGRSGFLVDADGANLLLDYGVMLGRRGTPPRYPLHVKPRDIDSVIITHAHLDHSGGVPSLFASGSTSVYSTQPTIELSHLLIEDMLKIEKNAHPFDIVEVNRMMRNHKKVDYRQSISRNGATFELRESGHVVGGSTVLVESAGKRLFYTGDINVHGTRMLREADLDIGDIDLLITESTYSQKAQTPRAESEEMLLEFANEVIDRKGILFVPSFSVERSQEIACVLHSRGFKHKIVMDGMALDVNDIILRHPRFLRDEHTFADVIRRSTQIKGHGQRRRALEEPCVVISPAGMLVGGNAVFYLQRLAFDERNGIALVSYQGDGTPGRALLDTGKVSTRGRELSVKAQVKQFEFSGHSDRNGLFDLIKKIPGSPKVVTVHGDAESCSMFAQEIQERSGLQARAGSLGEVVEA